ncbi:large proline-rich protein BAG6 [Galendromus occidentalis]|uniref:Large proline-rich protein BAG6 n=1 Tax=Galendromus occidentalis TaxID=34638 RepID=A0AAJ6VVW9_9ACAR|nr:large proline-rich protein BAG6 [Galendromus occidentalis]
MPTEVTVKTLDSNQYQFKIPDEFTVKEFKEHIASEVNVPWDKQRIIFGGKVLQDDRKLADCHVDKKTVHLVQKLPTLNPIPESGASSSSSSQRPSQQHPGSIHIPLNRSPGTLIVEAIIPPEQIQPGDQIEQIIRQVISTMGNINPMGVETGVSPEAGAYINQRELIRRLRTIRFLFRVAFSGVNALEGRPTETFLARNHAEGSRAANAEGGTAADASPDAGLSPPNATPRQPNRPFSYLTDQEISPTRENLSRVYQELDCLQERLRPFTVRYRELLARPNVTADDLNEQPTRQLTSRMALTLHAMSHIQHHLSDLEIDPRHPDQITSRQEVIPMAIHGRVNLDSVAFLTNVQERGPASSQQQQAGGRMTVGQAASQAAGQAAGRQPSIHVEVTRRVPEPAPSAQGSSQAASRDQTSTGTQTSRAEARAPGDTANQPSAPLSQLSQLQQQAQQHVQNIFSHFDIVGRFTDTAFRTRERRGSVPNSEAPSREDTTASNTTTNTTDTPTTTGSSMNSGPRPTTATINVTSQILSQGIGQFDPFLACDSVWTHFDRSAASRRGASQRSSSAPAPTRRTAAPSAAAALSRPAGASVNARAAGPRNLSGAASTDSIDFTFMTSSNFEEVLRMIFPNVQPAGLIRSMPFGDLIEWNFEQGAESDFFTGLLRVLLTELQSVDFLQVILQQRLSLLNSLREPLQNYLRQRLLNGMPQTPELVEVRVNEITNSWSSQLPLGIPEANILPGIDIRATLVSFLRTRLVTLFAFILNSSSDQEEFGINLFMQCRDAIGHACVLLALCCDDAVESVDRILDARMRNLDGVYHGPFPAEIMRRLRGNATPASQADEDALRRFIVRTQPADASAPVMMDVDQPNGSAESSIDSSNNLISTESRGPNRTTAPVSHEVALGALQDAASAGDPSESRVWRGVVPSSWAPIIARDVQSQSIQQRPLSDAYIEGMPSKRRRLMKSTNPSKLSNVHASLQEAIQRAGVRPRTSLEALGADLERNKMKLQDSLQKTIRDRLARRLTEDKDFESDKFPYAKRMAE